jgi:hypothetical protein
MKVKQIRAQKIMFEVLFPEHNNFCSTLSSSAAHCVVRAMSHLNGNVENTFPSTENGVIIPFDVKVG